MPAVFPSRWRWGIERTAGGRDGFPSFIHRWGLWHSCSGPRRIARQGPESVAFFERVLGVLLVDAAPAAARWADPGRVALAGVRRGVHGVSPWAKGPAQASPRQRLGSTRRSGKALKGRQRRWRKDVPPLQGSHGFEREPRAMARPPPSPTIPFRLLGPGRAWVGPLAHFGRLSRLLKHLPNA